MFPPTLEDWVPADHPARFIRDFVDALDLKGLGFRVRQSEVGRSNYASELLLKVWIYGYLERIFSSRKLERACREHLTLIWLTGNHAPDHNTLWRFWKENRKALKGVFRQTVRVALKAELIGLLLHAVDGTKLQSAGSRQRVWRKEELERLLEGVEESIRQMSDEVDRQSGEDKGEYRLPEELRQVERRREKIGEALKELERENQEQLLATDPEARRMPGRGGPQWSYNAQAVVDQNSGMVVGEGVTNEANDSHQLVPMLDEVKENLGEVSEENVADAGYDCAQQYAEAKQRGYRVLVSGRDCGKGPYHTAQFEYLQERDVFICPQGKELRYAGQGWSRSKRRVVRKYRCHSYRECPVRWDCSQAKQGRALCVSEDHAALVEQRLKRQEEKNRHLLRMRKAVVEPLFAWIKERLGFRRWTFRGLEKVRAQWSLLCACHNLKKLFSWWKAGKLSWA